MKKKTQTAKVSGRIVEEIARQLRHASGSEYGEEIARMAKRVWDSMSPKKEERESEDVAEWIFCTRNWHEMIRVVLMKFEQAGVVRVDGARYFLEPQTMEVEI